MCAAMYVRAGSALKEHWAATAGHHRTLWGMHVTALCATLHQCTGVHELHAGAQLPLRTCMQQGTTHGHLQILWHIAWMQGNAEAQLRQQHKLMSSISAHSVWKLIQFASLLDLGY